jgi:hypothetical protein
MKKAAGVFVVLAALAASCIQPVQERPAALEPGVLRVTLDGSAARTALPGYDVHFLYYTLAFTPVDGPAAESAEPVYRSIAIGSASGEYNLAVGTWDLEVRGFRSRDDAADPGNALASGSRSGIVISVAAGTGVDVRLVPDESKLTQSSTGILHCTVTFPDSVTQAVLTIFNAAMDKEIASIDLRASGGTWRELDSGVYNLDIALYMDGKIAVKGLTAHIYDGLTTRVFESFTEDNFVDYQAGEITAFRLGNGTDTFEGIIDQAAQSIIVFVPPATDTRGLTAAIEHTGLFAGSDPAAPDYSAGPVSYTITREDGATKTYMVHVRTDETVAGLVSLLAGQEANTPASPIPVKLENFNLNDSWANMLDAIGAAGKYVDLDLSGCTMMGTEFDLGSANTGEKYITGLVLSLPFNTVTITSPFRYFISLTTVSLDAITIGDSAFSGCINLTEVSLPDAATIGDSAFSGCINLTEVSLPDAATIGDSAFSGCTSLTEVSLPDAITIGDSAFGRCTSLTTVSLPKAATIDNYAFRSCTSLTEVSLPEATSIDYSAFGGCTSLTEVSLPKATSIDYSAFQYFTSLTTVSLAEATSIGGAAFNGCTSLTEVSLPKATSIGGSAFNGCTSLTEVSLPEAATIDNSAFRYCTSLTEVSLPKANTINSYAFSGCTSLTEVSLPEATSIGDSAFGGCTSLREVSLPEAATIGDSAFSGCARLYTVSLPKAATIGNSAFSGCWLT